MAIQRWDPVRGLRQLHEQLNRLFEDALARSGGTADGAATAAWKPPLDLFEEAGRYVLRADLPGLSAAEVSLRVQDGRLVLSGERRPDAAIARESYLRAERPAGAFAAEVTLPPSVDEQRIEARHRNGVLEISLPKRSESTPSRIRVSGD
jgi:HSP20 family protein